MAESLVKGNVFFHNLARAYSRKQASAKPLEQKPKALNDRQSTMDAVASEGSSGIATPSTDGDDASVSSQKSGTSLTSDPNPPVQRERIMETLISNLFTTGSSLENAYAQLQSALKPYDPESLQRADQTIIYELNNFSEFKRFYVERLASISTGHSNVGTQPEIQKKETLLKSYEGIITTFHSQIASKSVEVEHLKDTLAQTILKKEKLEWRLKKLEQRVVRESAANVSNASLADLKLLESAVLAASEIAKSFTKLLMTLMKLSEWDLDAAANSIHPSHCVRKNHRNLIFESHVWHRMLNGFENEAFYIDGSISSILDPEKHRQECYREFQELRATDVVEVISANPDGLFGKFCLKKFLELIHPKMEESFFGNMEHRKLILHGKHPRSEFYINFLKLAKAIWLVHRIAFSFKPTAGIFQAKQNSEFSPLLMESVLQDAEMNLNIPNAIPKVAFTVIPGFRVGKAVLKCQVYLTPPTDSIGVCKAQVMG